MTFPESSPPEGHHIRCPDLHGFSCVGSIGTRPRIQAADKAFDGRRILCPVDMSHLFREHLRIGSLRFSLGSSRDQSRPRVLLTSIRSLIRQGQRACRTGFRPSLFHRAGLAFCSSISPVSSPTSIIIVVTPLSFSPSMTAHWIGAAPRYLGSRDA